MGVGVEGVPLRELGLVILVAAAVTFLSTGAVRSLVLRSGRVAEVRARDVHTQPTPSLGGVAMFTGFLSAVLVANQLPALTRGFMPVTPEMNAVVWAGAAIVLVGIVDDLYELDAVTKLIGQSLSAVVMSLLGLSWTLLYLPVGEGTTVVLDQVQSVVLTTFLTVLLINALNFVDGLDGLAAGLGMIAGGAILVFSLTVLHDQGGTVAAYPPAIIAAGLVGMCAGFLPHNFEPSRIFMGDSGSMLIGLLLAAASTSASGKINMSLYGAVDVVALMSPLIVVLAAVFVPVLDLVLAVVRRLAKGQSPFAADRLHLHHRLLSLGHTHRRTVLVLYLWVSVVAFGAVSFSVVPAGVALIGTAVALLLAAGITFIPLRWRRRYGQRGGVRSGVRRDGMGEQDSSVSVSASVADGLHDGMDTGSGAGS
ncbi:Decaprenyl-phosphate N-acetylglucosaminephosphotransferase [Corynebacterium lowii]|uniref:Decaprenyl-phosphate N-acetylglucosaminephosphotransferase n=1 Tax=Corynebacterium lowii TaxID=1544413 RepID=A0A0Q1AI98_9CORY|nr:Decaprenyl-phosphate N-acetylglucosaminephosphotransferase [Corynebacterium lowii]MDP9850841.1 UDP-GlcNAc:undecaprenyl-phosphate GlcNAc-1-phosphate transferase [Corynebacterium lowii]